MTQKTLLTKLREHPMTRCYSYSYKTITRLNRQLSGDNLYILVTNGGDYPVAILRYRLDINFLAEVVAFQHERLSWDCYKAWELAIK